MNNAQRIRQDLHNYIDQADERMLSILQAIVKADQLESADSKQALDLAEVRRQQVGSGQMKTSSWAQVQERIQSRG